MRDITINLKDSPSTRIFIRLTAVMAVALFSAFLFVPAWEKSYVVIHTILENICILIALSSFFVIWYVSDTQQTNLILGLGFLAVAIFDVFHTFFWQGLGFFPNAYYDLSARYWVVGRFIEALFLILSTTSISKFCTRRYLGLAITVFCSFSVGITLYYTPQVFPVLLTPEGVTPIKIIMEYVIISMFIWFLFRVYKGYFKEDIVTKEYLILAVLIAVPAELCFTLFTTITNYYNILGHILKICYYYFFLRAVYAGFVVFPYKMIRLSEERFQKAFRHSPVLKSILSIKDGRFIDVNDMWLQTTGYNREDVLGKTAHELNLYPYEVMDEYHWDIIYYRRMFTNRRYKFQTKHGALREGVFSTQEIVLQDEPCVLMVTMDITDQVRTEKELLRLDRMNLVGQMAAGVAHEIRNPMTTVRNFVELLSKKEDAIQYIDYYNIMIDELDRANAIISEFLSLARNKPLNLQLQNLNKIIDDLYPLLQADASNAEKSVKLEKLPIKNIKIDGNEIHQLILNLVRNGLEAMTRGGKVTIKTFTDGQETVLAIKDEGVGIDPKILDKIGTPFITSKENGTGLGLATCYSIADRNNARIEINTSPAGTIFYIRFKVTA